MHLDRFFPSDRVDVDGLGGHLDSLSPSSRLAAIRSLDRPMQARLFEAVRGKRAIAIDHFVPKDVGSMREVIHEGRNTLPAFRLFQKRFCRPDVEGADELWGYNEQTFRAFTGPGYFVCKNWDDDGIEGVVIDYHEVPPRRPNGWPEIVANAERLGRFVYHRTRDVMRGVSAHVSIGRARRSGKWMDAWFVLCRRDA